MVIRLGVACVPMKVFISSLIAGFEPYRSISREVVRNITPSTDHWLRILARGPTSPQAACLAGVREADLVVLILGERYGARQQTGLSATHEEYRAARETKPVLAFVQEGMEAEEAQMDFIHEVQGMVERALPCWLPFGGRTSDGPDPSAIRLRFGQRRRVRWMMRNSPVGRLG